jgi:hypothetical protein
VRPKGHACYVVVCRVPPQATATVLQASRQLREATQPTSKETLADFMTNCYTQEALHADLRVRELAAAHENAGKPIASSSILLHVYTMRGVYDFKHAHVPRQATCARHMIRHIIQNSHFAPPDPAYTLNSWGNNLGTPSKRLYSHTLGAMLSSRIAPALKTATVTSNPATSEETVATACVLRKACTAASYNSVERGMKTASTTYSTTTILCPSPMCGHVLHDFPRHQPPHPSVLL